MYKSAEKYPSVWFDILDKVGTHGRVVYIPCKDNAEAHSYRQAWYQFHTALKRDKHPAAGLTSRIVIRVEDACVCIEPRKGGRWAQLAERALENMGASTPERPSDDILNAASEAEFSRVQEKVNAYLKGEEDVPTRASSQDQRTPEESPRRDDNDGGVEGRGGTVAGRKSDRLE